MLCEILSLSTGERREVLWMMDGSNTLPQPHGLDTPNVLGGINDRLEEIRTCTGRSNFFSPRNVRIPV